jgi:hypothetical protein
MLAFTMSDVYNVASPLLAESGHIVVCVRGPGVFGAVLLDGDMVVRASTLMGESAQMIFDVIVQFYVKGTSNNDAYLAFLLWLTERGAAVETLPHNEKVGMVNALLSKHTKSTDQHLFLVTQCAVKIVMSNLGCIVFVSERGSIYMCVLGTYSVHKTEGKTPCTEHASDNALQTALETWCCLESRSVAETREQRQVIFDSFAQFFRSAGFDVCTMPPETWARVQHTLRIASA